MVITTPIQGSRITLASLNSAQLSKEYQEWMKDKEVLKYLASPDGNYSLDNLKVFVDQCNASPYDYLLGIFLKSNGAHIGNIKIGGINPRHHFADVGIVIGNKTVWGQGFATESIKLCITFAFTELKLHKLFAGMIEGNEGSYKSFIKAGFQYVGCFHQHCVVDGEYKDSRLVEILNE